MSDQIDLSGMNLEERKRFYNARIVQLTQMLGAPGWELFGEYCKLNAQAAYEKAIGATDILAQSKHLGAHKALSDMVQWPVRELAALRAQLRNEGGAEAVTSVEPR